MQREERIYERRAAAQDGRRLRLEYCRLETPDENNKLRRGNPLCVGRLRGLRGAAGYHEQSGAHHAAADAAGGRSRDAGLSARDRRGLAVRDFFGAKSEFFPVCTGHAGAFLI